MGDDKVTRGDVGRTKRDAGKWHRLARSIGMTSRPIGVAGYGDIVPRCRASLGQIVQTSPVQLTDDEDRCHSCFK